MGAPRPRLAVYGGGALGASVLLQTILLWIVYFYAPPAGQGAARLTPALVGLALAGGRIVNALSNPPVAFWSDRLRTPWGRRRPFIAAGAPVLAAAYMLLWLPPAAPPGLTTLYAGASLAAFFFCFSVVMNPYAALLPEITPGGKGRVTAASWQAGASLAGVGVAMLSSPWLIAHYGFGTMGVVLGLAGFLPIWAVAGFVAEPAPDRGPAPDRAMLLQAIAAVLRNPLFRIYIITLALLWTGTSMVNSAIVFVITVLMGLPRDQVGAVLGASFLCTLAALPLLSAVTRAAGPARTLAWTLGITSGIVPLIGAIGLRGIPLPPPVQGYALVVLAAPPLAALLVLPNAILADISEADHLATGEGREGMFYAVQGLVLNAATAVASVALGWLLALGDSPGHAIGLRLIPAVAGVCTLAALAAFTRFPGAGSRTGPGAPPARRDHRGGRSR